MDTTEVTNVKEMDVNIEELLGTGIESIMVPGESVTSTDKGTEKRMFAPINTDTSFLDNPPTEETEKTEETEETEEASEVPTDNTVKKPAAPVSTESVDELLSPDAEQEEEDDDKKNKGGRPTTMIAATKNLIEKNLLLPFDDDKKVEDYTASDYEELIEANMNMMRENLEKDLPAQFFSNLPSEMQQAYNYIANGGQDIKGLFQTLATSQEIKTLDISTERGQEYAVRSYLQATNYGTAEEIEDEINSLADRGDLEKKANQFKPKLDAMSEQLVQQKIAAQEQDRLQREQQSQLYMDSVYTTLEKGELNGIQLDNKTQNFLYTALVQPNYPSVSGKQTNLLGHLLEKYQWVEPDHALIAEATYLLADPEGYRNKIKSMGETAATAETVRKLKTAQADKSGASSYETDEEDASRQPVRRGIPKRKKNFFGR